MACIKSVNRSVTVALSPESPYLAAGTMAGAVDMSFSSSANLEIFKLDFQSDDRDLPVVAETPSSERFNRLAWGKNVSGSEEFSFGIIAGGLVDGNIDLWNPLALIRPEASESASVGHLSKHKGPVRGLEFNAIAPNYLASGADEGEICIWDLAAPDKPSCYPPLKGSGSLAQGEISFLSWNSKVQHILASTSYNGTTVVWDLKKQKPVISFQDPIKRRCSVLQWNPEVATQLFVASDDDSAPVLRLWDMRNTMSPVKELTGHTKGVIAMSWCPTDSRYLITCAKDNRTICWDTLSGEIVRELPTGANWNFDIHWYPKIPGVISACSFDGKIGIYNLEGCSQYGVDETNDSSTPLRAPKWYKRPAGVSFCFGGKLVSFHPRSSSSGVEAEHSEVYVQSLVTEDSLVSRSSEFEVAIQNGERSSLRVLCELKFQESESEDDKETWGFLKVMFEDEGTARTKLLTHLGFSLPTEAKDDVVDEISHEVSNLSLENTTEQLASETEATIFSSDNGEDFFNNLPSPKAETPLSTSGDKFVAGDTVPCVKEEAHHELDEPEESTDPSFDDAVQRALVVGDYKAAVSYCISANKMADALVIAHVGGASLWESTRDQYLKLNHSPYLKVVTAMVNNDLMSLVRTRPLKLWKETLALLCSFAPKDEWTFLCDTLASKLVTVGNTLAATLCYICAGNIDKTVEIWSMSLTADSDRKPYVDLFQDLMEKTIVLALATGQKRFSASLCKLVEKYAEILASQGLLTTAMEYLKLLGSEELSPELVILRERIALCTEPEPVKEITNSMTSKNSQPLNGHMYGADEPGFGAIEASRHYYQETTPSQMQQSVPSGPYGENYQQPPFGSYGNGGSQPAPQPNIFRPSQAPQAPPANFAPPLVTPQPIARPFIPSTPVVLRNAEQYQQPSLGSQLYPSTNPTYQPGPHGPGSLGPVTSQGSSGPMTPHGVAPTPTTRGFIPVSNTAVVQRPAFSSTQPSTPIQQVVQPAVAPEPSPTIQTVDTFSVPAHLRPVISTLTRLFHETSEALGGSRANPAKKREIEDNSKKIGVLFAKLNKEDISINAAQQLVHLCQALDNRDFSAALQIQVKLTTSDWDECNVWLSTLKRMIKARQNVR